MPIVEVKVPQLSESVAEATLLQWKKKAGEAVLADEILIDVETDKVVLEVPAPAAGVLAEIVCGDGSTVKADQLIARIDNTVAWLQTVPASAIEGQEAKDITFPVGKTATRTMSAEAYLKTWALPNVFFHITTAYAILRHNGVVIGKGDYLMGAAA